MINPDVVDIILLREPGLIDAFLSSPRTTDRQVQDQILLPVIGPYLAAGAFVAICEIFLVIDEKIEAKFVSWFREI